MSEPGHSPRTEPHGPPALRTALIRTQAITGLGFAGFLIVHLATVTAALLGPGRANEALALARRGYQLPAVELAMLTCLTVHVLAGMWRWRSFERERAPSNPSTRAHRISGRVLALVLVGHVLATRGPTWFFEVPVDMGLVSYTLERYGAVFYPYYVALYAFGAFHMVRGVQLALARVRAPIPAAWLRMSRHGWRWWVGGFAALALAALLGLGGLLYSLDRSGYADIEALLERLSGE
jgi:succinate dehydrogenase/fumarate reductase cytochrome b subunit